MFELRSVLSSKARMIISTVAGIAVLGACAVLIGRNLPETSVSEEMIVNYGEQH